MWKRDVEPLFSGIEGEEGYRLDKKKAIGYLETNVEDPRAVYSYLTVVLISQQRGVTGAKGIDVRVSFTAQ